MLDLAKMSALSTMSKIRAAAKTKINLGKMRAWLDKRDAYTLHRPVKKCFARNPHAVNNEMDDLVDGTALSKYNDKYVYILSVIDVFSKFLHLVHLRYKTGTAVSSVFQSIFKDPRYSTRRPI